MYSLLLAVIYLAFISLGLPDALLGSGWPTMYTQLQVPFSYAGIISMIISAGTIVSSFFSDRLTRKFGAGLVTAVSVLLTAGALLGFSVSDSFYLLCIMAIPYGLGAGAVDAALNNYVALHYNSLHQRDSPPHHLQRFPGRNPLPGSAFPRHQQEIPQPRLLPHWCCTKTLHTQFLEAAGKLLCPFYRMQDT